MEKSDTKQVKMIIEEEKALYRRGQQKDNAPMDLRFRINDFRALSPYSIQSKPENG